MKSFPFQVFYSKRSFYKCISILGLFASLLLAGSGCGGGLAGGINLPAPTADLEGGSAAALRVLCGMSSGAPQGAIVQIINIDDARIPVVQAPLTANNTYSLQTCLQIQETVTIQILDSALNPISDLQRVTRTGSEVPGLCPAPTNTAPTCP